MPFCCRLYRFHGPSYLLSSLSLETLDNTIQASLSLSLSARWHTLESLSGGADTTKISTESSYHTGTVCLLISTTLLGLPGATALCHNFAFCVHLHEVIGLARTVSTWIEVQIMYPGPSVSATEARNALSLRPLSGNSCASCIS